MIPESADPPRAVRIRLLGTVTARADDDDIELGGPRARGLLAALALAGGRTLSADTLLRDVWGTATPGVRSALRATVSRLRATPLGPHLTGGRQGYALVNGPGLAVDLWELERQASAGSSGEPAEPADLAELAALVDLVPFDGAGDAPFLPTARAAARALVRRVAVRAIDASPTHPLALATTQRLLAHDPDDPELRALLIVARSGGAAARTAPAAPTRLNGLPTPIAVAHPRPEDEARLAAALRLSRLVTLVGPSGVGKTRLALDWARGPAGSTQEHIWFCRAGGGRMWVHELSRAIGADGVTPAAVIARMRPLRGTLLIDGLDDADREADRVALAELLEQAPGVAALVTARRELEVPGESVHHLRPLAAADARALFLLRSGIASATASESAEIDRLTTALGGLPLAIELAAARAAHTPLGSIVDELVDAQTRRRTGPLASAITATVALLDDPHRATLEQLTLFRGPFTRASARAVAGTTADADLDPLLRWALVTEESRDGLALLRVPEVVRRHLAVAETAGFRASRASWYADRTLEAFHGLTTADAAVIAALLESERAEIDAAFEHAIGSADRATALSISAGLAWIGLLTGTQATVLSMSRRAAVVPGRAAHGTEARALLARGFLSYQLGSMDESREVLEQAVEVSRRTEDPDLLALSHAFLAYLATLAPEGTRAAVEHIRVARTRAEGASPSAQAMVTLVSAQVERSRGDHGEAMAFADAARALAEDSGHVWVLLMSGVVAAKVLIDARDPRRALGLLRAVLGDQRVQADPVSVLIAASVVAGAAAATGADDTGARIIGAVDAIGPRYGFDPRANEPADFDRYRRRVQEGLTLAAWRDAYAHGTTLTVAQLIDEVTRI